jgi:hypothetical protein
MRNEKESYEMIGEAFERMLCERGGKELRRSITTFLTPER